MKKDRSNDIYVGMDNPVEIRKNILESSRDMIHALQSYEKLKLIRAEKDRNMQMLNAMLKEIRMIIADLQDEMPRTRIAPQHVEAPALQDEKPKKIRKIPKTPSELEKLESALDDIENKLSKLA
jgi:hypothetical protein